MSNDSLNTNSNSSIQTKLGQSEVLRLVQHELELVEPLVERRIDMDSCQDSEQVVFWKVDGVAEKAKVLVEVYSRVGALHGAQKKKVGLDILKLATIKEVVPEWKDARLLIAFASSSAMNSVSGWLKFAAQHRGVKFISVELSDDVKDQLVAAQNRQKMTNVSEDVEIEVLDDGDQ